MTAAINQRMPTGFAGFFHPTDAGVVLLLNGARGQSRLAWTGHRRAGAFRQGLAGWLDRVVVTAGP
jgi:hypothetical protein